MVKKNTFAKERKNNLWPFLIFLFGVGLGIAGYTAYDFMKTEPIDISPNLNSSSINDTIEFTHAHKLTINDKEIGIGKKFVLAEDLFKQGNNTIELQRVSFWGIKGISKPTSVSVDTLINKVKFVKNPPKKVFNLASIDVSIEKDKEDSLLVNQKSVQAKDNKITLQLNQGENKFDINTQDNVGNKSEVEQLSIFNEKNPKYKEVVCDKVKFYLNSEKVQIGLSGVEGRPEVTNESDEYFAEVNKTSGKCTSPNSNYTIQLLNTKAGCWNCGGGFSEYITIGKSVEVLNIPKPETKEINPSILKAEDYTTETGIIGRLTKLKTFGDDKLQSHEFRFVINNEEYIVSSGVIKDEQISEDFMEILNSLSLVDPNDEQNIKVNENISPKKYSFSEGTFSIQANGDWRVERGQLGLRGDYKTETLTFTKGQFTITVDKYLNEVGVCGAVADLVPIEKYKLINIDGLELYIPQYTKILPREPGITDGLISSVFQKDKNGNFDCVYEAGDNKYEIRMYHSDQNRQQSELDAKMEKEVNELLQTIKWK